MAHIKTSDFVYDCARCHTRCDGISKGVYLFDNDVAFSERYEQLIIDRINAGNVYRASKCNEDGYPDVEVRNANNQVHRYLEVKVQQRTFMAVEKYLPQSLLTPSETVALNLSDLRRYFSIEEKTGIQTSIVWVLLNRACIMPVGEERYFYQQTQTLKAIYNKAAARRTFKRKSGDGDVVNGLHKGVTVNYHFSLKELKPWAF